MVLLLYRGKSLQLPQVQHSVLSDSELASALLCMPNCTSRMKLVGLVVLEGSLHTRLIQRCDCRFVAIPLCHSVICCLRFV